MQCAGAQDNPLAPLHPAGSRQLLAQTGFWTGSESRYLCSGWDDIYHVLLGGWGAARRIARRTLILRAGRPSWNKSHCPVLG